MDHFPPTWKDSPHAVSLWPRLRSAPRSLLMLDYDGTLAPFHEDRFKTMAYPGVEERLNQLTELDRVHTVLVSGRPARELRALLPTGTKIDIWGSHGRELLLADGSYKLFALDSVQQATLQHVAHPKGHAVDQTAGPHACQNMSGNDKNCVVVTRSREGFSCCLNYCV